MAPPGPSVRPRWRLAPIGAALAAVLVLAGCGDRSTSPAAGVFTPKTPGVLTVVTGAIPTMGFWEGTRVRPTGGFEYELARDMAKRFGLKRVRVRVEPFDRIIAGHLDGADMALSLLTPTSEREQHLDFSEAYLDAAPTAIARAGTDIPDLATARTLRWGALRGTTLAGIVSDMIEPYTSVRTYPTDADTLAALNDHRIDAAMFDMPYAVAIANRSHGKLQAAAQLDVDESIAAALPKGSSNVQAVDSAIRAFTADGTIDALLTRWVGVNAADAQKSIPLLRTER